MKASLSFLSFLICIQFSFAQAPDSAFQQHVFHSEAFGKERKVTVHLPSYYYDFPEEALTVTYVLDAQGPQFFSMLCANMDYLTSRYRIIPTIVVGIHSDNRFAEFTPASRDTSSRFESKLPNLHQHFTEEVFPMVEKNYRTLPFKTIIGHSRGGSFVVQTLFDGHKDMFDAYLAISPALGFDKEQTIDLLEEKMVAKAEIDKFLYISCGDVTNQERYFLKGADRINAIMDAHPNPSLNYQYHLTPGKDHFTTVLPGLNEGLVRLKNAHMLSFENLLAYAENPNATITEQIKEFIKEHETKGSFYHVPRASYFIRLASDYFDEEEYAKAVEMYEWAAENGEFTRWWDCINMGLCYKRTKQDKLAEPVLAKGFELLKERKEEYGDNYDNIVEDLHKQIEEATVK